MSPTPSVCSAVDGHSEVLGIRCAGGHFNNPRALSCMVCGLGLAQTTRNLERGPRPSLGVLVLDDGSVYVLTKDYVIGREPDTDVAVRGAQAKPLVLSADDLTVSRSHAAIRLRDWNVEVCDLGSANGTYLAPPGESTWAPLTPFEPVTIVPGARLQIGSRTLSFRSHRADRPPQG